MQKVPNAWLLEVGLRLMARAGHSLKKAESKGRAMLYRMANGETVRVRTCNDHILIAVAESTEENAKLNIEGTNWLLIVMPTIPRTLGDVIAYLVPTHVAVTEVRNTHRQWLSTKPNTAGGNRTWNLWFDDEGPEKAAGYARKWQQYRLEQYASEVPVPRNLENTTNPLKAEVDAARIRIAKAAGVPIEAVRISIDFQS